MANIKTKPVEGEELEEREERKNNKSILSQVRPHFFSLVTKPYHLQKRFKQSHRHSSINSSNSQLFLNEAVRRNPMFF